MRRPTLTALLILLGFAVALATARVPPPPPAPGPADWYCTGQPLHCVPGAPAPLPTPLLPPAERPSRP